MRAQSVEEAGSLEAAVATIAARDYRKAVSTLEELRWSRSFGRLPGKNKLKAGAGCWV
jgi:hypothetical protein